MTEVRMTGKLEHEEIMKKKSPIHLVSGLAGLILAAGLTACTDKESTPGQPLQETKESIGRFEQFTAHLETPDMVPGSQIETRVFSDAAMNVMWEAGDRISIFNGTSENQEFLFTGQTGDKVCTYEKAGTSSGASGTFETAHIYAVYPYRATTKLLEEGRISYSFPEEQTYRAGTFGPEANAMVAVSDDDDLSFKNLGGLLSLSLYGEGISVSSIMLQGNKGETLSGTATVNVSTGAVPSFSFDENASKRLILNCAEPVRLGASASEATVFWMVVPPTSFQEGFSITVTANNGASFVKSTKKNYAFQRNKVFRMAAVAVQLQAAQVPVPEKVDMKTKSGAQWGSFNVGADKPESFGDYYAWGETEAKDDYTWNNYKFGTKTALTKYNTLSANGTVDNKRRLDPEDDVARVKIGGKWRMPTMEEQNELLDESLFTWTWTSVNGVNGYNVKCKANGNSIFLPAAGFWHDNTNSWLGKGGDLWSDTLFPGNDARYPISGPWDSYSLLYSTDDHSENQGSLRYYGRSVRPVCGDKPVLATSVSISNTTLSLTKGTTNTLTATVNPSTVTYKGIVWSSDDTSIATVTQAGVVKGIKAGTVTIRATAKYSCIGATCKVTVKEPEGQQAVDLGLPSGLKWASCNVNASKPEANGSYYAWAETSPKSDFSYSRYKWLMFDLYNEGSTYSKYRVKEEEYGTGTLAPDGKKTLEAADDAAHVVMGGNWRTPTKTEMEELINNCTWTWTTRNGVKGYKVSSKKSGNTNSIFLPAIGYKSGTSLKESGSTCAYWTASLGTKNSTPYSLKGTSSSKAVEMAKLRYYGLPVRAVCK